MLTPTIVRLAGASTCEEAEDTPENFVDGGEQYKLGVCLSFFRVFHVSGRYSELPGSR